MKDVFTRKRCFAGVKEKCCYYVSCFCKKKMFCNNERKVLLDLTEKLFKRKTSFSTQKQL